jgi:hypothetical protein
MFRAGDDDTRAVLRRLANSSIASVETTLSLPQAMMRVGTLTPLTNARWSTQPWI